MLISCAITFVCAYAKNRFSYDAAYFVITSFNKRISCFRVLTFAKPECDAHQLDKRLYHTQKRMLYRHCYTLSFPA